MAFINIFDRIFKGDEIPGIRQLLKVSPTAEETCSGCKESMQRQELVRNLMVCPKCGKYIRMGARDRITLVSDKEAFHELYAGVTSKDFLSFPGYTDKLRIAKEKTGEKSAVITGVTKIGGEKCAVFAMDSRFFMASMGSAVGEKITRIFEYATEKSLPVVGFTASGGARMQEGIVSLMQMAKVSGAVKNHSNAGNLYITVLTDPTLGGITASFAMQGDIIIAEPKAMVGFAGRRVVEQTTGKSLPDNFQSAEFLMEHGFVDCIVPREDMRKTLTKLLAYHSGKEVRK